jgi:putative transposase
MWAKFLKVSRSGYSAWKKDRKKREAVQQANIERVRSIFRDGNGTYGAERICGILRKRGFKASFPKVRDIMEKEGLRSIHGRCRKQRALTDSRKSRGEGYVNLVRGMGDKEPLQVLSSDISYIRTKKEGFAYICQIRDVASGVVLAESVRGNMKAELVMDTIVKAVRRWKIPGGSIFHSDRGSQYTSEEVKRLLVSSGFRQSFSRVGRPGDNAWSESFFANMKKEAVHWEDFSTLEDVKQAMFGYIEGFYNTRRQQERLGYLSPLDWLRQWYLDNLNSAA